MLNPINYDTIVQEIKETRQAKNPEHQDAVINKEAVRQFLEQKTQQHVATQSQTSSSVQQPTSSSPDALPAYAADAPIQAKSTVDKLITLTFQKGLHEGIAHAAKMDPFTMDLYHDALTEKLFEEMKTRKLI